MKRSSHSPLFLAASLPALLLLTIPAQASRGDPAIKSAVAEHYGHVPMAFEANAGQSDAAVKFQARGAGYGFYLTGNETVLTLDTATEGGGERKSSVLRTRFVGGNPAPVISGETALPGQSNYLTGADSKHWLTGVGQFGKVRYSAIYPGVDAVYYGTQSQIEYDLVVAPGADAGRIRMNIEGAHSIKIDGAGNLVIKTTAADLIQHKPVVYQMIDGQRVAVETRYTLHGKQVAFDIAAYDHAAALVIDPLLALRAYAPALHREIANAVAVDGAGAAYIAGYSTPYNYANNLGLTRFLSNDVFITKLNPAGDAIEFATYLGGSKDDVANDIAVDANGNIYVTGDTFSDDFPIANAVNQPARAGFRDGFVLKLDATGKKLIYSTFLGGVADDTAQSIAIDAAGSAYVAGMTSSVDFPTRQAIQPANAGLADAFVTKLLFDGSMAYSTYLGGADNEGASSIAVDAGGNAYVTGFTSSFNFPSTPGVIQPARTPNVIIPDDPSTSFNEFHEISYSDAFVTKINAGGTALSYSTYLGGRQSDVAAAIAVDSQGNAFVAGHTESSDFPLVSAFRSTLTGGGEVFVTKLNGTASALAYSTFLGGESFNEYATDILVDGAGRAWVTGYTASITFPTRNALQRANTGGIDAFVSQLNAAGNGLVYSSYLGAVSSDYANAIARDASDNIYLTGYTYSRNFTTTKGPVQGASGGAGEPFVTKIKGDGTALMYSTYIGENNVFLQLTTGTPANADGSGGVRISLPIPLRGIVGCTLRAVDGGLLAGTELLFPNHAVCGGAQPAP